MHPEWFFRLHYYGQKAAKLESGNLSHYSVCQLFLEDLTELRAGSVKQEKITQIGKTVGLTHINEPNKGRVCDYKLFHYILTLIRN